jgi:2-polyprenyl-3-methyl-5-hydroxy-6-metoxy-1,4-benzoquinol methylase
MEKIRLVCPSCDSSKIKINKHFFADWEELSEPMYLTTCRKCGLRFFNKILSDYQIETLYDDNYFQEDWCWYAKPYEEVWHLRKKDFEAKQLPWIMTHKKNGKVIDIGCGGGAIVKAFNDAGYEAIGAELNKNLAEFGIEELGVNIISIDVTKKEFVDKFGKFDIIYMSDLIEHLNYPETFLKSMHNLLRDDGLVIIDVPLVELNRFSSKLRQVYAILRNKDSRFCQYPYHLIFFKPDTLITLCKNAGYKIEELKTWKEEVLKEEDFKKMNFKGKIINKLDHFFPKILKKIFDDRAFIVLSG